MPPREEELKEIHRLVRENNIMLHRMRRNAFWGGLIKFILYTALLLIPIYLYLQYLAPIMNDALAALQQVQGVGAQASMQFSGLQDLLRQVQSVLNSSR